MPSLDFVPPDVAFAQRAHTWVSNAGLLRVAVVCAVLLAVAAQVHVVIDARARRARLLSRGEALHRTTPRAVLALDAFDRAAQELAREPFVGEVHAPLDLATITAAPTLYLRAVVDEVGSGREVHHAALASRKDAVIACFLRPPEDASAHALHRAAVRFRWRVDLDAVSPRVRDLDVLAPAVPGTRSFLDEVRATKDPAALRLLEIDAGRAKPAPDSYFDYGIVALDELPTGFAGEEGAPALAAAIKTSRLDDVAPLPHAMRLALLDLASGRVLLRVRAAVDARDVTVPNALADAEELQGCQAAVALRSAAR